MKKALFIGPQYLGLYEDIVEGLVHKGYEVDFIPEMQRSEDPYYVGVKSDNKLSEDDNLLLLEAEWKKKLLQHPYNVKYDLLFVLDGMSLHPYLFETLRNRNPQIKMVNYLFDTVRGIYRFDKFFKYYDNIATFDREESEKYQLDFLPIYWKKTPTKNTEEQYVVFGCGAFKEDRYKLYDAVKKIAEVIGVDYYLKLYIKKRKLYHLKLIFHRITRTPYISFREYHSDMIIHEPISADVYRCLLTASRVVVDTCAPHQDGLTARFMWAIGEGKKIITNNKSVTRYDFYDEQQIMIVDTDRFDNQEIISFLKSKYEMPSQIRMAVDKYRLDNWLDFLLRE